MVVAALRTARHGGTLHQNGILFAVSIVCLYHFDVTVAGGCRCVVPLACGPPLACSRIEVGVIENVHPAGTVPTTYEQEVAVGKLYYVCLVALIGNLSAKHIPRGTEVVGINHHILVGNVNGTIETIVLGTFCLTDRLRNLSACEKCADDARTAVCCTEAGIHEGLHNGRGDVGIGAPGLAGICRTESCDTELSRLIVGIIYRVGPKLVAGSTYHQYVFARVARCVVCHNSGVAEGPLHVVGSTFAPVTLCYAEDGAPRLAVVIAIATLDARSTATYVGMTGTDVGESNDAAALRTGNGRDAISGTAVVGVVVPEVDAIAGGGGIVGDKGCICFQ